MKRNNCIECGSEKRTVHSNTKYCNSCRLKFLHKPKGTMTESQKQLAMSLRGEYKREEIAKRVGVSLSNLKRSMPDVSFAWKNGSRKYNINPKLIKEVCEYYEMHGKVKTQKKFPNVKLRSIVERYKYYSPRQIRWTDEQIKKAAQMAGIVSPEAQARHFNRPRANKGSIVSLWMKKFGSGGGNVNGLSWHTAKHFIKPNCPVVKTQFWKQRNASHKLSYLRKEHSRKIVLWVDFVNYQKPSNPDWIKEAAKTMAKFQIWLHETKQVNVNIDKFLREVK